MTQEWLGLVEDLFAPYPHHAVFLVAAARAKLSGAAAAKMEDYVGLLRGSGKRRRRSDRVVFEYVKSNRGARQVLLIYERQAGALP